MTVSVRLSYTGLERVGQYRVQAVRFKSNREPGDPVIIEVELGRDFGSIFCITYLPTILMNIINQATNYLDNSQYLEAIISLNLTSLMVLSALYISVAASLPATSSIKHVDIWLLSSLIFPFLIVLLNIAIYVVNQGKKRVVQVNPITGSDKKIKVDLGFILSVTARYVLPTIYTGFALVHFVLGLYF